jgi:hypothetical protein
MMRPERSGAGHGRYPPHRADFATSGRQSTQRNPLLPPSIKRSPLNRRTGQWEGLRFFAAHPTRPDPTSEVGVISHEAVLGGSHLLAPSLFNAARWCKISRVWGRPAPDGRATAGVRQSAGGEANACGLRHIEYPFRVLLHVTPKVSLRQLRCVEVARYGMRSRCATGVPVPWRNFEDKTQTPTRISVSKTTWVELETVVELQRTLAVFPGILSDPRWRSS